MHPGREHRAEKSVHLDRGADLSDDRKLMGAMHNVFVGKVIERIGNKEDIIPLTLYSVEVVMNIKGNLQGTMTVSKSGGYTNGVLYTLEDDTIFPGGNDNTFLQTGATYLFATRYNYNETQFWYHLIGLPNAVKLITQDANMSKTQLQALAEQEKRVNQLREAYPNEILYADDVQRNLTRNTFQSLSPEQQVRIKAEIERQKVQGNQ